ncbi:MAG: MGMT family protein [Candidatus Woesearchaeota archaeon]
MLQQRCFAYIAQIPRGRVITYKHLAHLVGTKAYRYVGWLCKQNTDYTNIPCHRVVCSTGHIGGYNRGISFKKTLLEQEGIVVHNNKISLPTYEILLKDS